MNGINLEISFNNTNLLKYGQLMTEWKNQYETLPYFVLLLKQMLEATYLNETENGGLESLPLIVIVVSYLQVSW